MKKILFSIVAVCMSFNVFSVNDPHSDMYLDLADKLQEAAHSVKKETSCFILKRENMEIKKTEFVFNFCIVNGENFMTSSKSFHKYVSSINKKEEKGVVTSEKNFDTVKSYDVIAVYLYRAENGDIALRLNYEYQEITGWKDFKTENGGKIELPITKKTELSNVIQFKEKGEKLIYKQNELAFTLELL